MFVLLITLIVGSCVGLVAFVVARSWRVDLGAPKVNPTTVATQVRRHGRLAEWLSHVLNAVTGRLDTVGGRRVEQGYTPMGTMFGRKPPIPSRVRKLPALAHECVVIEDAPPGIQAARAAGMRTIGVTTTVTEQALRAAPAASA